MMKNQNHIDMLLDLWDSWRTIPLLLDSVIVTGAAADRSHDQAGARGPGDFR